MPLIIDENGKRLVSDADYQTWLESLPDIPTEVIVGLIADKVSTKKADLLIWENDLWVRYNAWIDAGKPTSEIVFFNSLPNL